MLDNLQDIGSKAGVTIRVVYGVAIVVYYVATALARRMSVSSDATDPRLAGAYLVVVPLVRAKDVSRGARLCV